MKIFDEVVLSETENNLLVYLLSKPVVIKYLRGLAQTAAMDAISSYNRVGLNPQEYTQQAVFLQGSVATLEQLLSLAVPLVEE